MTSEEHQDDDACTLMADKFVTHSQQFMISLSSFHHRNGRRAIQAPL